MLRLKTRAAATNQDSDLSRALWENKYILISGQQLAHFKRQARRANRRQAKAQLRTEVRH